MDAYHAATGPRPGVADKVGGKSSRGIMLGDGIQLRVSIKGFEISTQSSSPPVGGW